MPTEEESEYEPEVPDPGRDAERVDFDVTSGSDLVDRLPSGSGVPSEVARPFWSTVLLANVAILALGLGLLLALFRGVTVPAAVLVFVGLVAAIRTVRRVRAYSGP